GGARIGVCVLLFAVMSLFIGRTGFVRHSHHGGAFVRGEPASDKFLYGQDSSVARLTNSTKCIRETCTTLRLLTGGNVVRRQLTNRFFLFDVFKPQLLPLNWIRQTMESL